MTQRNINEQIAAAKRRLQVAVKIAAQFAGNDRLHRLSMETVFLLEDVVFTLMRIAEDKRGEASNHGSPEN